MLRFNDGYPLRKAGMKSNVYLVFRKRLEQGKVPGGINELLIDNTFQ